MGKISINIKYKIKKNAYEHDVAILKKYGDTYKIAVLKSLRTKGVELNYNYVPKGTAHEEKLDCNIRRSRGKIQEYVMCNDFEYFVTLTLDKKKYDRYNLDKFRKDLSQFIKDKNKRRERKIKYIFVPEEHKDGAWHMHGFVMGLEPSDLRLFGLDEHIPDYIRNKLIKGQEVYEWGDYHKKFGFCDLEPIRDKKRAASYIRKYITKELASCVKEVGAHMYYCSRGLEKSKELKRGTVSAKYNPSYVDEHVSVQWLDAVTEEEARSYVQGNDTTSKELVQEFMSKISVWQNPDNLFYESTGEILTTPFD